MNLAVDFEADRGAPTLQFTEPDLPVLAGGGLYHFDAHAEIGVIDSLPLRKAGTPDPVERSGQIPVVAPVNRIEVTVACVKR